MKSPWVCPWYFLFTSLSALIYSIILALLSTIDIISFLTFFLALSAKLGNT
jgi:VIT1/CCC1 family predicted Fe2+/Mn2+ transporter